jgi:predicted metal-binding membrane protein
MSVSPVNTLREDGKLILAIFTLAVLAATTLYTWGGSAFANFLRFHSLAERWPMDIAFMVDWGAMCIAMMLPTAHSLLRAIQYLAIRQRRPALPWLTGIGFMAVWLFAGLVLRFMAVRLADSVILSGFISSHRNIILALMLLGGSLYTISSISIRCASACRSPIGFIATGWSGHHPNGDALRIGKAYGLSCFGCCWPQMLILSIIGMSNPFWMLITTMGMLAQKSRRFGKYAELSIASGLAFLAIGSILGKFYLPIDNMLWNAEVTGCMTPRN